MPPPKSCSSRLPGRLLLYCPPPPSPLAKPPRRCPRRPFRALGIHTARLVPFRGETPALQQHRTDGNRHAESRGCGQVRGHERSDAGPEDAVRRVRQHLDIAIRCVHTISYYPRAKGYFILPVRSVAFPQYHVVAAQ
jgi:hypothetical protein